MKQVLLLFILTITAGCVSEVEHRRILEENEKLKTELDDLKFGIPNLYTESKKLFELGDFEGAKSKIDILTERHPDAVETIELKEILPIIEEEILWNIVNNSNSLDSLEKYREKYPRGKYSRKVYSKKKEIIAQIDKSAYEKADSINTMTAYNTYLEEHPNGSYRSKAREKIASFKKKYEKQAYEDAKRKNTSYAWNEFLKEYPNHWDRRNIKEKIISLKVDEIMGDANTGALPSFSQTNYGSSSSSSVTIKNNTGHSLTVRYSGPSVREIVIPRGGSSTTSLTSGYYKIAASAGGLHYAGRENLSGSYSSTYYISTTRY